MNISAKSFNRIFALLSVLVLISACGGGSDDTDSGAELLTCSAPLVVNDTGTSCVVAPPISCPIGLVPNESNDACVAPVDDSLPAPSIAAAENQAIVFYNRPDGEYDGYELHIWNNGQCDAYTDAQMEGITWTSGVVIAGYDSNYGAYWVVELKDGHSECGNYIIHNGDDKEQGGADKLMDLTGDRMNWVLSGVNETFSSKILKLGVSVSGSAAHWVNSNTLLWSVGDPTVSEIRVHSSAAADLIFDAEAGVSGGTSVSGAPGMAPDEALEKWTFCVAKPWRLLMTKAVRRLGPPAFRSLASWMTFIPAATTTLTRQRWVRYMTATPLPPPSGRQPLRASISWCMAQTRV
jgi:pullulanase